MVKLLVLVEFLALARQCAPSVEPKTMAAITRVESGYNPYAIGVVGGHLERQPKNREEAVATAKALAAGGWNFSLGLTQVNRYNLPRFKISYNQAFDACTNLRVGSKILEDCYTSASETRSSQEALQAALSCYYSGNFTRGFKPGPGGSPSYVQKVLASADTATNAIPVIPYGKKNKKTSRQKRTPTPSTPADNSALLLTQKDKSHTKNQPATGDDQQPNSAKPQKEVERNTVVVF